MEFPIRKLLRYRDSFEPLAWWKNQFGQSFSAVKPFLYACDDRMAEFFPSPDDPSVQLFVSEAGRKYRAVPPEELEDKVEDLILDWEDVQVFRLDCVRLRKAIRLAFNLKPAAGRNHDNLLYVGRCECNRNFRHVYACLSVSSAEAHKAIEICDDPDTFGCILFPTHSSRSMRLLKGRGIASVNLRECLSLKKDGFHGECPVNCADYLLPANAQLESRIDTIEKTVLPDASRGSKTIKSASAGGRARAKTYQPKYEEARRYMLNYHRKNPSVSFTQVRKKAAQHLPLSESSLKTRFKKADFTDW